MYGLFDWIYNFPFIARVEVFTKSLTQWVVVETQDVARPAL